MNKAAFLKELSFHLRKMQNTDKDKFLSFYDEMIFDYMENGMSEEEAVKRIGTPQKIADELFESQDRVKLPKFMTGNRILNSILLIIGFPLWGSILLSGILLLLSIYLVLWCIPLATGAGCIGFLGTSIVGIIGSPFMMAKGLSIGLIQLGLGIASVGISILFGFATLVIFRKIVRITKTFNKKLIHFFRRMVV